MNTELLLKVKEQILKEPKQFVMLEWYSTVLGKDATVETRSYRIPKKVKIPNCGTAACIAGWAGCFLLGNKPSGGSRADHFALGLDYEDYERLIHFKHWPKRFRKHVSEGTLAFAKQAAARIDHFIATNGRE